MGTELRRFSSCKVILGAGFLIVAFILGCGAPDPEISYSQIEEAVAERNWLKFSRYVDVDEVVMHFVNDVVAYEYGASDAVTGEGAVDALLSSQIASGMEDLYSPMLRDTIRTMVESGDFDFGVFLARVEGADSVELHHVGEPVVEGKTAALPLFLEGVSPDDEDKPLVQVDLLAEWREDVWVFNRIDRLGALLSAIPDGTLRKEKGIEPALASPASPGDRVQERRIDLSDDDHGPQYQFGPLPNWYRYDEGSKTVILDIVAGQTDAAQYWNFNGHVTGEVTVVVPVGAEVTINFSNRDGNGMAHSIGVSPITESPPAAPAPEPVFEGAISSNAADPVNATGVGQTETITFTADRAGEYSLLCYVPGHAVGGMWIRFTVSQAGEAGLAY